MKLFVKGVKVPVAFKRQKCQLLLRATGTNNSALIPRSYPRFIRGTVIGIAILSIFLVLPKQTHAASYVTGRFNKAISFDGTGDYVDMGDVSSSIKTVDFWVSPDSTTEKILDLNGSAYIDVTSGTVAATGFTSPTIYVDGVVSSTLTTGWHHIAVTTGTGINGNSVIVGKIATTYFTGLIDSVRMYDRALSASEIAAHYSLGRGKHDNYAAKIKLAANDSNSYLDETLTNGQDYLASFWYHPGEDNANAISFKVSGSADPIMAEHNLMASSTMGLVGAWNFEEGGSSATTADLSGNGHTATLSAGAGSNTSASDMWAGGVSGKFGQALEFDGTDDNTTVTTFSLTPDAPISIEAWFKTNSSGEQVIASKADDSTNWNGIIFWLTSSKLTLYLLKTYGEPSGLSSSSTIQTGVWYHGMATYDGTNVKIYLNGGLDNSGTSAIGYDNTAYNLVFGEHCVTNGVQPFDGLIDSVRIYNRALTASEVYDRYKAGDWHKYELSFEADQDGAHLFKFIQDGSTSGNSIVYVDNFRVDKNLVNKGGFEAFAGGDPNIPTGWSNSGLDGTEGVEETAIYHTGSKSMEFAAADTDEGITQTVTVESGKWYTFSGWAKNNNLNLNFVLGDATTAIIDATTANNTWTKFSKTFKSSSTSLTVSPLSGADAQTGYFDDISVVELDSTSTYTDPTTTTPSTEANSYTTGKWSDTTGSFLIDGGDRLRYSAGGVLPNDAGTVSVWWKPVWDYNKFEENVYLLNAESASANLIRLFYDKTNYYYTAQLHNGTNWTTVAVNSAAQTFSEDAWQHIILSYDNDVGGSAGSVVLYVNGASSGTPYSSTNWTAQTVSDYFYIGSLFGSSANTNQAGGWFDDFRIYSSQLSAANINALYGLDPNPPTTATWKRNLITPIISE